jgi:FkbM family methyltransferase
VAKIDQVNQDVILIDAIFFQLYSTGIARLWKSLLEVWSQQAFRNNIIILDRNNTCPKIPGLQYLVISELSDQDLEADRSLLQAICDQENASLFISTYYTTPISTPSVFMGYDMIPEVLGWDLTQPMWQNKHHAINQAIAHITISENTAQDLQQSFPSIDPANVHPIFCGVAEHFKPASQLELMQFRDRYNIQKPYFLLVGASMGYKNAELFLEGLAQLHSRRGFEVICTGSSARQFSAEARALLPDVIFHALVLADHELRSAYSGAIALVYPSKYEGFGLPIVEAMKCGCPVITCPNASIPEVGGDAVFYIPDDDIEAMSEALLEVQKPSVRQPMIEAGDRQAQKFTWTAMAEQMQQVLLDHATRNSRGVQANRARQQVLVAVDWQQSAEQIHEKFQRFFEIICDFDAVANYHFLISAIGTTLELADEIVGSALMQVLMVRESTTVEPSIELTDQSDADLHHAIVTHLGLADVQTLTDLLEALSRNPPHHPPLVTHRIHGYDLEFPLSHALPGILQRWPHYSSNLGRIAQAVHQKYADLKFIDIGANVGDSVAILRRLAYFPILCIEGDRDFLHVLSRNAAKFEAVTIAPYYVGEDNVTIAAISTGIAGTAHLVSADQPSSDYGSNSQAIELQKLSRILADYADFARPKMIKTDTDGFDGKILRGAADILGSVKPVVFFEYDPFFLAQQKDDGIGIFSLLLYHGYSGLIVYDNFGDLLLCLPHIEIDRVEELNLYFSNRGSRQYCDICAFHQEDQDLFEQTRQSELAFFRNLKNHGTAA